MNSIEERLDRIESILAKMVFQNCIRGYEHIYYHIEGLKNHAISCQEKQGSNLLGVTQIESTMHNGVHTIKVQAECCCIESTLMIDGSAIPKEKVQEFVDMINKEISEYRKASDPIDNQEWNPISNLDPLGG